jgi:hypothetical protein
MNTSIDPKILKQITGDIYRRFPEMAGVRPKVQLQKNAYSKSKLSSSRKLGNRSFLITFRGRANLTEGNCLPRLVRVVVNPQGKITKITTSR